MAVRTETEMNILLLEIKKVWKMFPELRFGQLMVDIFKTDPFYLEDNETMKKIIEFEKLRS